MKINIADLVHLITTLNYKRERNLFFDYSGHVNEFSIRIYKNGWENNCTATFSKSYINNIINIEIAYNEVLENV